MAGLGSAHGTLTIDASNALQNIKAVQTALGRLGATKMSGGEFDAAIAAMREVSSAARDLSNTKVNIDTSQGVGSLNNLRGAAQDTASTVSGASGASFTVDTADAIADVQNLATATQDVTAAIAGSSAQITVDTSDAQGQVTALGASVDDVSSKISGAKAVFGLDAGEAVSGLALVSQAADDAVARIQAASGTSLSIDTSDAIGQLQRIGTAAQELAGELQGASGQTIAISVTTDQIDRALAAVSELRQTAGQNMSANVSVSGIGELEAATTAAETARDAIGDIGSAAPSLDFSGMVNQLNEAANSAGNLGGILGKLGTIGLGAGFAGALITPLVIGIKNAAELEQAVKNVDVALGGLGKADLSNLTRSIRQIGADSQFSAKEVANVAEQLAKAGYDVSDLIEKRMLPAVIELSSATGDDLATATTAVIQAMATWSPAIVDSSIALTDAARAADILTVAANSSSADLNDIVAGMRNLGPVVSQLGVSFDEAAAAISIFTNYGLKGADAGVSLARGLQNLQDPTSKASQKMAQLGIDVFDTSNKFIGMPALFAQLSNAMSGLSQEARFSAISVLFGAEAQDAYALAVSMGKDPLIEVINLMQQQGIAAEQASERTQTLSGAWQRVSEGIGNTLGSMAQGLVAPLTLLADAGAKITDVFALLPSGIQAAVGAIALVTGVVIAAVTTFNLMSAALTIMGTSFLQVTGISAMVAGIQAATAAVTGMTFAVGGLTIALGPLLLAGVAIGAVAIGIKMLIDHHGAEAKKLAQDYKDLKAAQDEVLGNIAEKRLAGLTVLADNLQQQYDLVNNGVTKVNDRLAQGAVEFQTAMNTWTNSGKTDETAIRSFFDDGIGKAALDWASGEGGWTGQFASELSFSLNDASGLGIAGIDQTQVQSLMDQFFTAFKITPAQQTQIFKAMEPIWELYEDPNIDPTVLRDRINGIMKQYLDGTLPDVNSLVAELGKIPEELKDPTTAIAYVQKPLLGMGSAAEISRHQVALLVDELKKAGNLDAAKNVERMGKSFQDLEGDIGPGALNAYNDAWSILQRAMQDPNINGDLLNSKIEGMTQSFLAGKIGPEEYAVAIQVLSENTSYYLKDSADTTTAIDEQTAAQLKLNAAMAENATLLGHPEDTSRSYTTDQIEAQNKQMEEALLLKKQLDAAPGEDRETVIAQQRAKAMQDMIVTQEQLDAAWGQDMGLYLELGQRRLEQDQKLLDLKEAYNEASKPPPRDNSDMISTGPGDVGFLDERVISADDAGRRLIGTLGDVGKAAITGLLGSAEYAEQFAEKLEAAATRAKELAQAQTDAANEMVDSFAEISGMDPFAFRFNMTDMATEMSTLAGNITATGAAMDNTQRIFIGNTNAIQSQIQGLDDWATKLIDVRGTYSDLDDLLAEGRIDKGQYDAAQTAQEQIRAANESITKSVKDIQATAAPVFGELATQQAKYLENLSAQEPAQQAVALAWMDSATAGQAYNFMQQAVAVANGEMGESGKAAFEKMIVGAAEANPGLLAILKDMGLISVGAEGEITINYDKAKGAKSEIAMLTESIDALTLAIGGVPPLHLDIKVPEAKQIDLISAGLRNVTKDGDDASASAGRVRSNLGDLDGTTATTGIVADDTDVTNKVNEAKALDGKVLGNAVLNLITERVDNDKKPIPTNYSKPDTSAIYNDAMDPVPVPTELTPPTNVGDVSLWPQDPVTVPTTAAPITDPVTYDGPPATVPVHLDMQVGANALSGAQGAAQDAMGSISNDIVITTTLNLVDNASGPLVVAFNQFQLMNGQISTLTIAAMTESASSAIGGVQQKVDGMTDKTVTISGDVLLLITAVNNGNERVSAMPDKIVTLDADPVPLYTMVSSGNSAVEGMPDKTVYIFGDISPLTAAISVAESALANMSSSKTITITTIAATINEKAKGGYVTGKGAYVPVRLAEQGPEYLEYPGGGGAMAMKDGLYSVPNRTYVYTAAETAKMAKQDAGQFTAAGSSVLSTAVHVGTKGTSTGSGLPKSKNGRDPEIPKDWYDQVGLPKAQQGSIVAGLNGLAELISTYRDKDGKLPSQFESAADSLRDIAKDGTVTSSELKEVSDKLKELEGDDAAWADTYGNKIDKLANSVAASKTAVSDASNLFTDKTWQRRKLTMANPNDVSDLFEDRTRVSRNDFTLKKGRYTEHYGSGQVPSGVGSSVQNVTITNVALDSDHYAALTSNAEAGKVSSQAMQGARTLFKVRNRRVPVK